MPRILVIDDSRVQRVLARALLLEDADFEVSDASDGQAGLSKMQHESVDCILLDWLMPDMSGHDVLLALQEQGKKVPVIVVTSAPSEDTLAECSRLGVAAVIDKIQDPEELVRTVESVLLAG